MTNLTPLGWGDVNEENDFYNGMGKPNFSGFLHSFPFAIASQDTCVVILSLKIFSFSFFFLLSPSFFPCLRNNTNITLILILILIIILILILIIIIINYLPVSNSS